MLSKGPNKSCQWFGAGRAEVGGSISTKVQIDIVPLGKTLHLTDL